MAQLCREVAAVMQEFTRTTLLTALRLWNLSCVQSQCSLSCLRHPDRLELITATWRGWSLYC